MHICVCPGISNSLNGGFFAFEMMSTASDRPSLRSCVGPYDSGELDVVIKRLSMGEDLDGDRSEKPVTPRRMSDGACIGSPESEPWNGNNNTSDGGENGTSEGKCACGEKNKGRDEEVKDGMGARRRGRSKKRTGPRKKHEKMSEDQELTARINGENKSCGTSREHNSGTVGGDGEESRTERSRCRQHELNLSSNEINRPDVIKSCDLTSNSVIKIKSDDGNDQNKAGKKDCPGSRLSSCSASQTTCSEGSYSRRKHHKHHKHKQKSKSPVRPCEMGSSVSPKVNPIFVWVRQENTRIVEVLCEDYDHRNRLRLTRTQRGWRAIPKTKCFAEAIIPKAKPSEEEREVEENPIKPKQMRKMKKRKKSKKKKKVQKNLSLDNQNLIKECSVALYRDDLTNYKSKISVNLADEESSSSGADISLRPPSSPDELADPEMPACEGQSRPPSPESMAAPEDVPNTSKKLTKSNSCDFPSPKKAPDGLPRSISLDFKQNRDPNELQVQKEVRDDVDAKNSRGDTSDVVVSVKNEPEIEKGEVSKQLEEVEEKVLSEDVLEEADNPGNHSDSLVMDMTKHDSDFNDTDSDELGQLLKDIPDLEFVEEEELEEVDEEEEEEEEEWSMPTDLTIPKTATEISPEVKLPVLPANISPLVTVTSSVKPSEPLTAPLPEVTITPILNPKPAHQQKPQNNFLESLLFSSRSVKSESEKFCASQKTERRSLESSQCERKTAKHFHDSNLDSEVKNKKLKLEELTLKNLLSKHQSGKTIKSLDLETCVRGLKMMDGDECSKSRLQELLTDSVSSDPISQLKEVLSNPHLPVPDPLLVPRARLPALVASPASEIPRLLTMHLEKAIEETPCPVVTDPDVLEVSLSNLQSLLSCNPEKLKSENTQDLANYQKSLETFLEWQRYQTELMEAQMKSSKSLSPGFPGDIADVAAATAFSQMLWLPYLNQLDFNANRDFLSLMNSMLSHDYQANSAKLTAPPQINISQVPQPSPFLTPTSPMDIESHLKTLAMWQEAVMMQQTSQSSRACTKVSSTPTQQDVRRSSKNSNLSSLKKQSAQQHANYRHQASLSPRRESVQNSHLGFEIYQDMVQNDHQKKQMRQNSFQQRLEEHQKHLELHQKYKQEQQNHVRKMQRSYSNYQNELLRQCKGNERKKSAGGISVKPLSNLIDKNNLIVENKYSWEHFEEEFRKNSELANQLKVQQFNSHGQKNSRGPEDKLLLEWQSHGLKSKPGPDKHNSTEVKGTAAPKLKVKNLVDPNMSPPKLLKQIAPEHLPIVMEERGAMQEDPQGHLWHPLFGSNQIKQHPYNSPWRWTTVTVNGE